MGLLLWTNQHNDAGGNTVTTAELRRNAGSGWTPVVLPTALGGGWDLDTFAGGANINLVQDPATHQVWLVGQARDDDAAAPPIGSYLWTSSDDGATWSGPRLVYDDFSYSAELAPDGAGGFYMTTDEAFGTSQVHIPAGFATQDQDDKYPLTPRSSNAPATQLAAVGPSFTPVHAFLAQGEPGWPIYVHPGAAGTDGTADRKAIDCGENFDIAGNTSGGLLAVDHAPGCAASGDRPLYVRSVDAAGNFGSEQQLSAAGATFFDVAAVPGRPSSFVTAWKEDSGTGVWFARSETGASGAWSKTHVLNLAASGFSSTGNIAVSSRWVAGTSFRASDAKTVLWVTDTAAVTPVPVTVETPKKQQSYSKGKGKLKYGIVLSDAGTVTITVQVKVGKNKGVKAKSFYAGKAGSYQGSIKLPKKLKKLAKKRKAKITITITVVAPSGAITTKTIKVKIKR